jgi:hypothetical protein
MLDFGFGELERTVMFSAVKPDEFMAGPLGSWQPGEAS